MVGYFWLTYWYQKSIKIFNPYQNVVVEGGSYVCAINLANVGGCLQPTLTKFE